MSSWGAAAASFYLVWQLWGTWFDKLPFGGAYFGEPPKCNVYAYIYVYICILEYIYNCTQMVYGQFVSSFTVWLKVTELTLSLVPHQIHSALTRD